jgi:DNA-binding CsgD family transcriptional regulator
MDRDLLWVGEAAEQIAAAPPSERARVLGRLAGKLFDCDRYARVSSDDARRRPRSLRSGSEPVTASLDALIARAVDEHPAVMSYRARPRDLRPRRLSDLIGQREWLAHSVYRLIGRDTGNRYQLTIWVRPGHMATFDGWVFNRVSADFLPAEVERATRLQGALVALDRYARSTPRTSLVALTEREREILTLLARGDTAFAIGRALAISERTVRKHLENAYRKLGARDRLTAVRLAGLLD